MTTDIKLLPKNITYCVFVPCVHRLTTKIVVEFVIGDGSELRGGPGGITCGIKPELVPVGGSDVVCAAAGPVNHVGGFEGGDA